MAKIVVGTDGSPGAQHAVRWALGEARIRGAVLHVVHAWMVPVIAALPEPWALGTRYPGPPDEEVYAALLEAEQTVLDEAVNAAGELEPQVEIAGELVESRPAQALIEAARDADLLVVGSRGRGGFTGLLLGSVSAQCVHHAPCPVVVVPTPA